MKYFTLDVFTLDVFTLDFIAVCDEVLPFKLC